MRLKSPEDELEEFLAGQPSWRRKLLLDDLSLSKEEASAATRSSWIEVTKVHEEYLELLRRCPSKLREYRQRRIDNALSGVPLLPSGAPRKDGLAKEAAELRRSGLSWAKIALALNHKHGPGTTTAGAIRQLLRSRK
jgi:hypothetical protein